MKAAVVKGLGQKPSYGEFADPVAAQDEWLIEISASALSPLTRGRASGSHYSSAGRYPFVAGVDGVGRLEDGRSVYFVLPRAPFGGLAERAAVPKVHCLELPAGLDEISAAAIANPGMSSWAALTERARFRPGESVLINGATGASGQLAVQIARHMGARRVVATGRNHEKLAALRSLGADEIMPLTESEEALDRQFAEQFAQGIDVVLDYLWGPVAERILRAAAKAGPEGMPIRFVQIGNSGGAEIALPGSVLRSSGLELLGSGLGSVPLPRLIQAIDGVFRAANSGGFVLSVKTLPLSEIERAWDAPERERVVFLPG